MSPDTIAVGLFTIVGTLREQLEAERQAQAEARRLLAAALERIPPQIEAPSEARESPEGGADMPGDRPRRSQQSGSGARRARAVVA